MSIKHAKSWLAAWTAMLFLASAADAQQANLQNTPFHPVEVDQDMQSFERFDPSTFGEPTPAKQGYFFSYERGDMFITRPKRVDIGKEGLTAPVASPGGGTRTARNSLNTGLFTADDAYFKRIEFGFVDGRDGWLVGILGGQPQDQIMDLTNVEIVFEDPATGPLGAGHLDGFIKVNPGSATDDDLDGDGTFGRYDNAGNLLNQAAYDFDDLLRLPVLFSTMKVRNKSYIDGVELMRLFVSRPVLHGSILELQYGVRFFKFRDRFNVSTTGGILDESFWNTLADNHVVGPQIAMKWYKRSERWTLSAEGRFLAGFNSQSLSQRGEIGSNIDPLTAGTALRPANTPAFFEPVSFNNVWSTTEWAPSTDLRVNVNYHLTRDVSLKVGWTGMYSWGIARASNAVEYTLPTLGIRRDNNRESFLTNAVTFGFEWNR